VVEYKKFEVRKRIIISVTMVIAFFTFLYLGTLLETVENCSIIPKPVITDQVFWEQGAVLCLFDFVSFWLISAVSSKIITVVTVFSVFALRGAAIGNAVKIFFTNSVPSLTIILLLSYCIVTLMMMSYTIFIHGTIEIKGTFFRLFACFIVTGACAFIRLIPYFFIN